MAITTVTVSPGDDLYRLAAQYYGDATAWTLIARANGLTDPLIQTDSTLDIPVYNAAQANDGTLASQ
ncbi:LysM peptidoglycan-binding domain-containing protein [Paraburkholderia fungorum]|uniref:LysM peptidoglycan-binding domain-containing protein n=1 Tax=Paraburkholderia fungorum TaxID=134537 RepID=UPI0038BB995B